MLEAEFVAVGGPDQSCAVAALLGEEVCDLYAEVGCNDLQGC
ncbi:hypothetical protein [Conexibacter sp. S30A1]|nr:hypothetical protein [Conexibacter sp. S30A1]